MARAVGEKMKVPEPGFWDKMLRSRPGSEQGFCCKCRKEFQKGEPRIACPDWGEMGCRRKDHKGCRAYGAVHAKGCEEIE